jgi:hypothetical protein
MTVLAHCTAESRHNRRWIAGSGVHVVPVPPSDPPVPPTHTPFVHAPLQARPQPPQFVALELTSTHADPQSIWFAPLQVQAPALQVAPAGQGVHPPQ